MDDALNLWLQMIFRWTHVVAAAAWTGLILQVTLVQARVFESLEGEPRRLVIAETAPRSVWWMRWLSLWTFVTGFLLLGLIYYMGDILLEDPSRGSTTTALLIVLGLLVAVYLYDLVARVVRPPALAAVVALSLLAGAWFIMSRLGHLSGRALYLHTGVIMGTAMLLNVWMRIAPAWRRHLAALHTGETPDPALVARAAERARHNLYMVIPVIFLMVSTHYPAIYAGSYRGIHLAIMIAAGLVAARLLLAKSRRAGAPKGSPA